MKNNNITTQIETTKVLDKYANLLETNTHTLGKLIEVVERLDLNQEKLIPIEKDIINGIFHWWFEDMTKNELDASIEQMVEGLKDGLQMMIDNNCGDTFINDRLLLKLENPSYHTICFIHESYMDMRENWIKQQEEQNSIW